MEPNEVAELHEHAEHAKHNPALIPVTVSMSILAVLVAVVSLLGHRAHTEEVLLQSKVNDDWAFYQAKSIRRNNYELFRDLISIASLKDESQSAKLKEKYDKEIERYKEQQKELKDEADHGQAEVNTVARRANRFDLAEVFLEAALVITSLTLLTGKRVFFGMGGLLAVVGLAVAASSLLVH